MSSTHFPLTLGLHGPVDEAPDQDRRFRYAPLSIGLHVAMVAAFVLAPLFGELRSPEPVVGVRAFFVEPSFLAPPPPPPPPPPAAAARASAKPPTTPPQSANAFLAPIEVPDEIARPTLNIGAEGGVAGGVEGGIEGGVAGGIVGGLPSELPVPKPPVQVVRVGGDIRAPARLVYVPPEYPQIAAQAGVQGMVILEARVGTDGRVKEATVLRGQPLFDDPAKAAVMQWRYQPLLLNGVAQEFVLSVTVQFKLRLPS